MSDYVREKVLRVPVDRLNLCFTDEEMDDLGWSIEKRFSDIFGYADIGKFQFAPTYENFIDFVLDYEYGACGEYGKTRALTEREKEKYLPVFQKIDPDVNMDFVRLVEFCWYNCCEAPDYYDETKDDFNDEV
jgi:hypothetical protein